MANQIIDKALAYLGQNRVTLKYNFLQTNSIAGNSDGIVSYASVFSDTPYMVIVNGWTPASTWNTTMSVQEVDTSAKTIKIRTFGTTAQAYRLRLLAVYLGG